MRTPAKKHTHILRTLFGFALSLLMLVPFAMIVMNSFKNKKERFPSLITHFYLPV